MTYKSRFTLPILKCLLFVFALHFTVSAVAQTAPYRYTSVGLGVAPATYIGDLYAPITIVQHQVGIPLPSLSASVMHHLLPHWSVRGAVTLMQIRGDDAKSPGRYQRLRNLNVRNDLLEVKADVLFHLWHEGKSPLLRPAVRPYLFAGVAYVHQQPKGSLDGKEWVKLAPLSTEGQGVVEGRERYSLHQIAVPLGGGFYYKISDNFDLQIELGGRYTFTGYLDDVNSTYVDGALLPSDEARLFSDKSLLVSDQLIADQGIEYRLPPSTPTREGYIDPITGQYLERYVIGFGYPNEQRGTDNNDYYVSGVVGLVYTFGRKSKTDCFEF